MSNFRGHLLASAVCGCAGAAIAPDHATTIMMCGFLGGVAPDVDLGGFKSPSIPNTLAKTGTLLFSWGVVGDLATVALEPYQQAIIAFVFTFMFWTVADSIFKHRGMTHTWLGALCTGLLASYFSVLTSGGEVALMAFVVASSSHLVHLIVDDLTTLIKGTSSKLITFRFLTPARRTSITAEYFLISSLIATSIYGHYHLGGHLWRTL